VIVKDEAGNKAAYTSGSTATASDVPASYTVSGAISDGLLEFDGTYSRSADVNGKPAYSINTGGTQILSWNSTDSRWELTDSYGLAYYNTSNSALPPPDSGWYDYSGGPALNLSVTAN